MVVEFFQKKSHSLLSQNFLPQITMVTTIHGQLKDIAEINFKEVL